ncbi:hypothetical protein GCM10010193_08630 [Kitasatospora atroaurantiaca]|uniref:Uncharacterized protein n=1 Tax=Kitasatospora atroaurantiaca TaxID=285545 RepID=A0A561ERV1_9ACTN|nr:hypothetical protein [Kitasatospora atroaurantiaca]TWE18319.1 hypothetical protein FB465_3386 [Kitasatospora atroaurantiaca]
MPTQTLYRLAGWAGAISAAILLLNSARRGALIPDDLAFTHALAPLAEAFGLFLITGLYLADRQRSGTLGAVGYTLNFLGMAGLLGVEYILNLVFPELTKAQITSLVGGLTGVMFTASSIVFLAGAVVFGAALWRAGQAPRGAVAAYVLGATPVALRGVLPTATFPPGLLVMAVGVACLGITLIKRAPRLGLPAAGTVAPAGSARPAVRLP